MARLRGNGSGGCAWPANGAIRSSPYARCWHLCCSPSPGLCTASQASACLPPYPWAGALSATRSCSPTKGSAAPPSFRHPASGGRAKRCISTFCPTIPPWSLCTNPSTARVRFWGCSKRCSPPAWPNGSYRDRWLQEKSLSLPKKDREYLALAIHDHMVTPSRSEGMGHAEAAAGGVDTSDVNPRTLESRKQPGLYFAGEVLDVTGLLGGYNLHWAWASGKAVGESWKK